MANGLWANVVADRDIRMADWRLFSKMSTCRLQRQFWSAQGGWFSV